MSASIRLYGYWRSSASWRIRIALAHKGLDYDYVAVNLLEGEHREAAHGARNPLNQVPVLTWAEGGGSPRVFSQSMAILDWLEGQVPEPALFPADPLLRARAIELAEVVNAGIHPLQNSAVLGDVEGLGGDRATWARGVIGRGLLAMQELAAPVAGTYLVGGDVSIADVLLVPQLYNARRYGVDLAPLSLLTTVEARCQALPAFQAAHADRQPDAHR